MKTPRKSKAPQVRDYLKIVEWSEKDQCYIGSAPPLVGRCCHADKEADVLKQLSLITEEVLAIHQTDGTALPPVSAGKNTVANSCSASDRRSIKHSICVLLKLTNHSTAIVPDLLRTGCFSGRDAVVTASCRHALRMTARCSHYLCR